MYGLWFGKLPLQDPRVQYSFPLQARAVAEQVHELLLELQMFPRNGLEHDTKFSEQRHSPSLGSQKAPVFLPSQELRIPHRQTPSTQVSPATLHSDEFWPLHCISKMNRQRCTASAHNQ